MSTESDVWNAVDWAVGAGARSLALLHCVSAYPTPDDQQNLRAVATLAREYKLPTGLSDHGMGADAALLAYAQGATLYERHVHLPGTDAIDAPVSSTPEQLHDIVRRLARAHAAMGDGRREPVEAERPNILPSRRGLYARRALAAGELIAAADVVALRPAGALGAEYARALIGCRAPRDHRRPERPSSRGDLGTAAPEPRSLMRPNVVVTAASRRVALVQALQAALARRVAAWTGDRHRHRSVLAGRAPRRCRRGSAAQRPSRLRRRAARRLCRRTTPASWCRPSTTNWRPSPRRPTASRRRASW